MARRNKVGRDEIVEAALAISESSSGLEAVTVRSIAKELGIGTMTLYGYFRNKDEILDAMADKVMSDIDLGPAAAETPAEAIRAVAHAFRDLMSKHPSVSWLLSSRVTRSHTSLKRAMEDVLHRLVQAGLSEDTAIQCYGWTIQYAMGFAAYQAPRPWGTADPRGAELRRQQQHYFAGLPADQFPVLTTHAADLVTLPTNEQFDWGLEQFVRAVTNSAQA